MPEESSTGLQEPDQPAGAEPADTTAENTAEVSWTASEFVHHEKTAGWYFALLLGAAILSFFIYVITKDVISVVVVIVAAIFLGYYGSHQPRQLQYKIDAHSLVIGNKAYSLGEFKSFSIVPVGAFSEIIFLPLKRFAPSITVYYSPEDQDKIMSILSASLPYEEPKRDSVDAFMRRIRF